MPKRNWLSSQIHSSWFRNLYWLTYGVFVVSALWHCVINLALKTPARVQDYALLIETLATRWVLQKSCEFVLPFHLSDRDKGLGIKRFSFKHQENILPLSILSISHFWHPSHSASTQTFHLSKLAPPASLENGWLNLHWKSNATKADWIIGKPGMPKGIALVAAYNAYAFWLHQVELVVWCFSKTRDCSSKHVKDFH